MSWWRTWQDRREASLPRLVFHADRRTKRRAADDHAVWVRERLVELYSAESDLRQRLGIAAPPKGRPKRPTTRQTGSVKGQFLRDFDDLLGEWDWDFNGDLDPLTLRAGSKERVAWRCLLNPAHVWETKLSDRTYHPSFCPFHMGNRVHPSESFAAYFPWFTKEWQPTKNDLHPAEVSRASGREVVWLCDHGHEWSAVVYQRTLSKTDCPACYRLEASARAKAGKKRARRAKEERVEAEIRTLIPLAELAAGNEPF